MREERKEGLKETRKVGKTEKKYLTKGREGTTNKKAKTQRAFPQRVATLRLIRSCSDQYRLSVPVFNMNISAKGWKTSRSLSGKP